MTLGSLRFGVKTIPRGSSLYSTDEGSRDTDVSVDGSKNCDTNCFESTDCCCIGATNSAGDGQTIYRKETRLPVANSNPICKFFLLHYKISYEFRSRTVLHKKILVLNSNGKYTQVNASIA